MYKNKMLDQIGCNISKGFSKGLAEKVFKKLRDSQQFFLGDVNIFYSEAVKLQDELFSQEDAKSLPYESLLLCYRFEDEKYSTLAFKDEYNYLPCVYTFTFAQFGGEAIWNYCPLGSLQMLESEENFIFCMSNDDKIKVELSREMKSAMQSILQASVVLTYFIKLLGCKNIKTETVAPDMKLNKSRLKKKKLPLFEYKVLNVELPGHKTRHSFGTGTGVPQRVHLCRGHFKEYTPEKPLFGRLVGRYWWQPTVRGKGDGIIEKEYHVKVAS